MQLAHRAPAVIESELAQAACAPDIQRILRTMRIHLGMDVAFISRFAGKDRIFQYVEGRADLTELKAGSGGPLDESYCQRIIDGRLPELISNASNVPEALAMPVTRAIPVGAHMSVPLRFSDGSLYGTFCCFSHAPRSDLTSRDLDVMRAFAEITAHQIEAIGTEEREKHAKRARIEAVLAAG